MLREGKVLGSRLSRPAYNPDTAESALWKQRAACRPDSNLWFSEYGGDRQTAAHICKRHCPVFAECHADANDAIMSGRPPRDQVVAGVRYTLEANPHVVPTNGVRCDLCHQPDGTEPGVTRRREPRPAPPGGRLNARRAARNVDLLHRLANGDHTVEMAAALHLSVDTIKCHLRALYVEIGAKDRAHAVAIAYQRGLLRVDQ